MSNYDLFCFGFLQGIRGKYGTMYRKYEKYVGNIKKYEGNMKK